jgi:hypothetical protein
VSGNQTHSASLGNRVGLHYSRFRLFARANSVNNQWFTDSIRVQNRHFQTRIREDGLAVVSQVKERAVALALVDRIVPLTDWTALDIIATADLKEQVRQALNQAHGDYLANRLATSPTDSSSVT